jgi:hypothetical protein
MEIGASKISFLVQLRLTLMSVRDCLHTLLKGRTIARMVPQI